MKITYVVQHLRSDPGEFDDLKFIGVYSTKELALDAVDSHKDLLGFMDYPDGFDIAAGGELAWPSADALEVIDWLGREGLQVCGVEIWLPAGSAPEIATPFVYTWTADPQAEGELWADFVERSNREARAYVFGFQWDEADKRYQGREPFFNLTVCPPEPIMSRWHRPALTEEDFPKDSE